MCLPGKNPLFLSDFNETPIFSTDLRNILKYQIAWKSVKWEPSCSMRTNRQTEMTKLIVAFSNFTKAPKKGRHFQVCLKSGKSNTLQEDLSKFIRRGILVINVTIVFMVTVFTSFTTVINISVFFVVTWTRQTYFAPWTFSNLLQPVCCYLCLGSSYNYVSILLCPKYDSVPSVLTFMLW